MSSVPWSNSVFCISGVPIDCRWDYRSLSIECQWEHFFPVWEEPYFTCNCCSLFSCHQRELPILIPLQQPARQARDLAQLPSTFCYETPLSSPVQKAASHHFLFRPVRSHLLTQPHGFSHPGHARTASGSARLRQVRVHLARRCIGGSDFICCCFNDKLWLCKSESIQPRRRPAS